MADDLKRTTSPTDESTDKTPHTVKIHRPLSDEEQAFRSLDDTVMRPMPEPSVIWESEPARRPTQPEEPRRPRIATGILVAGVAVVSFVAGGLTARMSSQVPVLFSQEEEPIEATASYEQPVADEQPYEEVEQQSAPTTDESYDTGYSTDYDTGYDTTDDTQTTEEPDVEWNFAPDSNGSVGYDSSDNEVTFNYDGYSYTFSLDDLLGTQDSSGDSYSTQDQSYGYGDETGYDTYEQRDYDNWSGRRPGWGSYHS